MAEPGIGEYLKAAFKVPYNLILFTGGMLAGVVSLYPQIVWPLVLAAELVYLTTMATRRRFQAVVRARRQEFNQNGEVFEGPPPRPLDLYKLQIVEEKLVIDTASVIERKKFEPSQIIKG